MPDWLLSILTPLASSGLLALALWLLPVSRWTRAIKSDQAISRDLPEGPERAWYAARAVNNARRVMEYTDAAQPVDGVLRWASVIWTLGWPTLFFAVGVRESVKEMTFAFGDGWPFLVLAWVPVAVLGTIFTFLGRDSQGHTPAEARAALEHGRAQYRRDRVHRMAKRRAKRAFGKVAEQRRPSSSR